MRPEAWPVDRGVGFRLHVSLSDVPLSSYSLHILVCQSHPRELSFPARFVPRASMESRDVRVPRSWTGPEPTGPPAPGDSHPGLRWVPSPSRPLAACWGRERRQHSPMLLAGRREARPGGRGDGSWAPPSSRGSGPEAGVCSCFYRLRGLRPRVPACPSLGLTACDLETRLSALKSCCGANRVPTRQVPATKQIRGERSPPKAPRSSPAPRKASVNTCTGQTLSARLFPDPEPWS